MSLIDEPIPLGAPAVPLNGHTPMHANEPTWCRDCGKFFTWWGPEGYLPGCPSPGAGTYDTDTAAGCRQILEDLGVSR